jgi:predicted transglutaminase-like cysteine proteinase
LPADAARPIRHAPRPLRQIAAALALGLLLSGFDGTARAQGVDVPRLQRAAAQAGTRAEASVRDLLVLLQASRAQPAVEQLQAVNHFFNSRVTFSTDMQVWGQVDHWASPVETLAKGAGDCEDYAVAKYFSLLALGVPAARLRLVYVRALVEGLAQAPVVLAYYPDDGGEVLVLDNLVDNISPATQRSDLKPIFSFNGEGLWQGVGPVTAGDPAKRLSRWREVMVKARAEGFQ